jgi:type 1 fimbria pilin
MALLIDRRHAMKIMLLAVLLSASFVLAQDAKPAPATPDNSDHSKGQVTLQGCVTRANGDWVLVKQDPGVTYELQASGKIKFHTYLGQRVEVTGKESASLSTSSDAASRNSSPVTITVSAIKTLDKECPAR